jgi:hypothetical protein
LAGVGRTAVSNWRRRFPDFPAAVGATTNGDLFDLREVERWLIKHGKIRSRVSAQQWLWRALDAARGADTPDRLIEISAAFLACLHLTQTTPMTSGEQASDGRLPSGPSSLLAGWPDHFGRDLLGMARRLEAAQPGLRHILTPLGDISLRHRHLIESLVGLVDLVGVAAVFEALVERRHRWLGRRAGGYWTSPALVQLVVQLAAVNKGRILDPAAGEAGFLLASANASDDPTQLNLSGQEINESTWRFAMQRLIVHELRADLRLGNSLLEDQFPDISADWVLCDPPYGLRDWGATSIAADSRWAFGLPTGRADFAWIQHAIAHLHVSGRAVVILPIGTLYRGAVDARIRAQLIRSGAVESVVVLPAHWADGAPQPLALWILRRPSPSDTDRSVLLIDASDTHIEEDSQSVSVHQRILDVWQRWQREGDAISPIPGFAAAVPVLDLLSTDASIVPPRWIGTQQQQPTPLSIELLEAQIAFASKISQLRGVEEIRVPIEPIATGDQHWSVGDLIRDGLLYLRPGSRIHQDDFRPQGVPVLGPVEIRARGSSVKSRFVDPETLGSGTDVTRPGDIVVLAEGNHGVIALVDEQGGHVVAYPCQSLRVNDGVLDPYVVAAFLQSRANTRLSVGTAVWRVNLQDVRLPRLTMREQQVLSSALRTIDQQRRLAEEIARHAEQITGHVVDGIASGAFTVIRV